MPDKLPPVILIADSDEIKCKTTANSIERYWFRVVRCYNVDSAYRSLAVNYTNMIILSSKIIEGNAKDFIGNLTGANRYPDIPVIIIADKEEIESFDSVKSDSIEILARPFDITQLMLSIKSLLRKSNPVFQDKILQHRNIKIDLATYQVYSSNRRIKVGPTEFKILELMMREPYTIFSGTQIIDYVWGADVKVDSRTVDVHINRLRSMLHYEDSDEPVIKTIRSSGYCLIVSKDTKNNNAGTET
jgi:two-component system phosphate regulon response regulator PhoB